MQAAMAILDHDQGCPFGMDDRMERLEREISEVRSTVIVLDERQQRMHQDFQNLTLAMQQNTDALNEFSTIMSNRKGFLTGVITVVTLVGGVVAAFITAAVEWAK